jgi:hypothetical protein
MWARNNAEDPAMKIDGAGKVYCDAIDSDGSYDYAEYFEVALTEHTVSGLPPGVTVALTGSKVIPASQSNSEPIGVTRPEGVTDTRGGRWKGWKGKYEQDAYDAVVWETYTNYEFYITGSDGEAPKYKSVMTDRLGEVTGSDLVVPPSGSTASISSSHMVVPVDEDGNPLKRKKYSSEYIQSLESSYQDRSSRPEWVVVGLLGQIPITDGQPTASNWINMGQVSESVTRWLVK